MSDDLPQGWVECLTGDIAKVVGGGTPNSADPGNFSTTRGIPWLTPADLSEHNDIYVSRGKRFLTKHGYENSSARLVPKGTVLFSSRAPIGYVAVAQNELATNQGFKSFVCEDAVCPEYLYFYLKYGKPLAEELASGTTFAEISGKNAARIPLRLAPLNEQQRIVAKLERLFGKVDTCQRRLAKIPALLKRFRRSLLAAACSGRLTADWREANGRSFEEDWRDADLSDICTSISDGDHQPPPKQASGIPFLTIGNISSGRLDFSETRFVSESYFTQIKPDRKPARGDVLYTVVGATIGIPVLVDTDLPFCFQRHIALIRASKVTTPAFLRTLMASPAVFREAWSRVTGSAQPTLPLGKLRTLPISVPPLAEQHEIVRRVDALFALANQIEARAAKARAHLDRLTPCLLAKAFRGELVRTEAEFAREEGRDYEPASVLLERIRASRVDEASASRPSSSRTIRRRAARNASS